MVRLDIGVKRYPSLSSDEFHEFASTFPVDNDLQLTELGDGPKSTGRWSKAG